LSEILSVNFKLICDSLSDKKLVLEYLKSGFKGRVHCFSIRVVKNKCFLLNPEKNFGVDPSCRFREKCKKRSFKNYVTEPKVRLL